MSAFGVTAGDLHTHAGSVQKVADTLGQAVAAAQQVTMGVQAYGMICGPLFVPIVMAVSAPGLLTLQAAQEAVTTMANEVKATADHYDEVDKNMASSFTAVQGRLS